MNAKVRLVSAVTATAFAVMVGSLAFGQMQDQDQQKCINAINKDTAKVAATQGKANSGCVKTGTKGPVAANCPTADPKSSPKTTRAEGMTSSDNTKDCVLTPPDPPDFGYTSDTTANHAAVSSELNLLADTYGTTDLSGVILTANADGKCQAAVTKDLEKVAATKWKQFVACKKATLKAGASSAAAIAACVTGDPNSIAADPKRKISKTLQKLHDDIGKDCGGPGQIAADFPGGCSGSTTANLNTCLDHRAECEVCLAINAADGVTVDCDLFDDGIANSSCGAPSCTNICPMSAGTYTGTTTGGSLKVGTFAAFAFPAGSTTIQDVSCAGANCVHTTVIPYPGGLSVPAFCIPALGATLQVTQTGCGVGRIDSDGGSDFTITEHGDTSETTICGVPQTTCPFAAPDSSGRLDVTVGDGIPDTCTGGGTANGIGSIPVHDVTWVAADSSCPDVDGTYDPGTDTLLSELSHTLDFTTDSSRAAFVDIDGDGCSKSGLGPAGPYSPNEACTGAGTPMACCTGAGAGTCSGVKGTCIDLGAMTVSVAGSGTIFSSGGPTYDLLFETVRNSVFTGPATPLGATCSSPPVINFSGTATRCIVAP